jgi:hypothetical protein
MTYQQPVVKTSNGLATAALVIGIIAVVGSVIPVLNIGSVALAILAFIFALIGLSRAKKNRGIGAGMAVTGLILAVLTVIITTVVNTVAANLAEDFIPPAVTEALPGGEGPTEQGVDPEATEAQQQAQKRAEQYLATMPFSKSGLIEQLKYDQYELADAKYGVGRLDADWNEQAALKADQYLDTMSFSRDGLIDQLVHDGFTEKQATHGVTEAGL